LFDDGLEESQHFAGGVTVEFAGGFVGQG
jgi:hypothetical protein